MVFERLYNNVLLFLYLIINKLDKCDVLLRVLGVAFVFVALHVKLPPLNDFVGVNGSNGHDKFLHSL